MNATITVVCYKSKTLSNGEHPLMLRICKDGKKKYQSLGISIKANQWDFVRERPKPTCPNKEHILKLILNKQAELQQRMLELNAEQKEYTTINTCAGVPQPPLKTALPHPISTSTIVPIISVKYFFILLTI